MSTPVYWMMIGLPGTGKSTFVGNMLADHYKTTYNPIVVISTDAIIEEISEIHHMTYDEGFKTLIDFATIVANNELEQGLLRSSDIIHDQTNLSVKSRASKLSKVPSKYKKIAYVFQLDTIDPKEWNRRLNRRSSKTIPGHVLESMANSYQAPTLDEGFNEIVYVVS